MKNTVQARPHGGIKRPSSQAQTPTPPAAVKQYALQLFEWTKGDPGKHITIGKIDISLEALGTLKENSKKAGDYACRGEPIYTKLLNIGLQAMLNAFPHFELENATAANNALLQLLCENIEFRRQDTGASS